jgi:hypothetical protein
MHLHPHAPHFIAHAIRPLQIGAVLAYELALAALFLLVLMVEALFGFDPRDEEL